MFRRSIAKLFLLACCIGAPLSAGAAGYEGLWQGRGTLDAGPAGCPSLVAFQIQVSGVEFSGTARSGGNYWPVTGTFTGAKWVEGKFYAAIGTANFSARYSGGKWRGTWDAEGECDGRFYLERVT